MRDKLLKLLVASSFIWAPTLVWVLCWALLLPGTFWQRLACAALSTAAAFITLVICLFIAAGLPGETR